MSAGSSGGSQDEPTVSPVCDLSQRLLAAHERSELCFWFQLDSERVRPIRGPRATERLVEAELHLFKLLPEPSWWQPADSSGHTDVQSDSARSQRKSTKLARSSAAAFHLKTNLLEVSLYQVMPRARRHSLANATGSSSSSINSTGTADAWRSSDENYPLRLLDIRRIDLLSSGWETFYVKRAVDDWLRNSSTNLGLLIKAKSMFDEPIRIGLIRFADAHDHHKRTSWPAAGQMDEVRAFDRSHQPLLVVYTRPSDIASGA